MQHENPVVVHPPHGTVVACEHGPGPFALELFAGRHRLHADEPREVGGTDSGPNPYELLAAALAACTVMTLRMYARHKGLSLGAIRCAVRHEKIHAEDCAQCETRVGKIDRFERVIEVEGRSMRRPEHGFSRSPTAARCTARSQARSSSKPGSRGAELRAQPGRAALSAMGSSFRATSARAVGSRFNDPLTVAR